MMIDDDDVRFLRAIAHARDEACIVFGTLLTQTRFGARVDVTPERERLRQVRQFGAIADFRLARPLRDFFEVVDLVESFEHGRRLRTREAVETKIVAATLHVGRGERLRQDALEKWDVFLHQLFLKVLRSGRDDHATIPTERGRHCGNEIRERLPRAGARLDDEMPLFLERAHHRPRHLHLARSILVLGMRPRDQSIRTKNFKHLFATRSYRWDTEDNTTGKSKEPYAL